MDQSRSFSRRPARNAPPMQAEQTSFAHGPREDAEPDSLEALFIKGERRAQNQQEDMHRLRQHFQTSRAIISKKEYELRQAKRRITHLEEELNDCRAQVFRSIPVYEVSDTMLSEEFRALRENLANWVEGLPELTTFTTGFQLALEHFQVFALSKPWPSSFPVAAAEAQSEIIQRVAFQHLFNELFCEMLPAAPSSDQSLLENLQNGMSRLEPKKDPKSIDEWRSDTVRAYTSCHQYQQQVKTHCSQIAHDICDIIKTLEFVDHCNWGHKLVRFEEQIANPASQLATKMSSAPEQYRWEWYEHINGKPNIVIRKWGLEALTVLDIETHNKISTTKYRELPNDRKIGGLLFVMYPELFRHGREEKKDILIEKAVVVVHTNDQQPSAQLSVEPSAQPSVQSSVQPSAQLSAEPGTQPRIKIEVDSSEKKT